MTEVSTVKEQIEVLQTELQDAKSNINKDLEEKIRLIVADMSVSKGFDHPGPQKILEEGDRELQIIVGGFDGDKDANIITATIDKFLEEVGRDKIVTVGTFTDPAPVGYIEFQTEHSKKGFYKRIQKAPKHINGVDLMFSNNRTFDERKRDKTLGIIKHQLIEEKGIPSQAVRIDWKRGFVELRRKRVASVSDDAVATFSEEAQDIKTGVETTMKAWVAKRNVAE